MSEGHSTLEYLIGLSKDFTPTQLVSALRTQAERYIVAAESPRCILPAMAARFDDSNAFTDRYHIDREVGSGGMARVFLARDLKHDREVAIKVLRPELSSGIGKERFLREIKLAARLMHPHILPLFDSGEDDGALYFVMPYVKGASLRVRLAREGQLPLEDALEITRDIAGALDYAHRQDIVHRDIKPENIMIHDGVAMVTDFGIGKALRAAGAEALTQAGALLGTPAYMSPEQVAGETTLDGRSDIYSLGCVLYEMLTGRSPFTGQSIEAIIAKRLTEPAPALNSTRETIPNDIRQAVHTALAKEPDERFATGAEFADALAPRIVETTLSADGQAEPSARSIAVLPFANMSTDPENEFFSDGITEEIINALAQLPGLHVAARTSAFSFKGENIDLRTVGEKLNVATVLEGSVRKAGNRVRITAQLIDAADGYHHWSERYDRELDDIFAIQDDIARAIADRLKVSLENGADSLLVKPHTDNLEAYELYLKGRSLLYKRGPAIPRGLECFNQALALDPDYALAHAGRADGNTTLGYYGLVPGKDTMPQAKEAATKALELAPDLAEAHNAFAVVSLLHDRDWQAADQAFRRALELNPQYVQARAWYGLFYLQCVAGRFEEGVAEMRRCVEIDPLSGYNAGVLALVLGFAGYHEEAIDQGVKATELDPDAFITRWTLQVVYGWASRYPKAAQAGEEALAVSGRHVWAMAFLAATYGNWGKPEKARALYEELKARTGREYIQPSMFALAAHGAGLLDEAIALFRRAYEERDPVLTVIARHWPEFAPLREDPRGQEIITKMGYP